MILGGSTNTPYSSGLSVRSADKQGSWIRIRTPILTFVFPFLASLVPKLSAFFRVALSQQLSWVRLDFGGLRCGLHGSWWDVVASHWVRHEDAFCFDLEPTFVAEKLCTFFHSKASIEGRNVSASKVQVVRPKNDVEDSTFCSDQKRKKNFFALFENFVNYLCISGLKSFSCPSFVTLLFWTSTRAISGREAEKYAAIKTTVFFLSHTAKGTRWISQLLPLTMKVSQNFWCRPRVSDIHSIEGAHAVWIVCPNAISVPRRPVYLEISRFGTCCCHCRDQKIQEDCSVSAKIFFSEQRFNWEMMLKYPIWNNRSFSPGALHLVNRLPGKSYLFRGSGGGGEGVDVGKGSIFFIWKREGLKLRVAFCLGLGAEVFLVFFGVLLFTKPWRMVIACL